MRLTKFALEFAKWAHRDQKRKYTNLPYWKHCEEVGDLLIDRGFRPEVIAAGYLHDVIEDTQVSWFALCEVFGQNIADWVSQVTNISEPSDGNRGIRKQLDNNHLGQSTYEGASIKLADIISNCSTIRELDPGFASVYIPEKRKTLQYIRHGDSILFQKAKEILI